MSATTTSVTKQSNEISPHIPSGMSKSAGSIIAYLICLTAVYSAIYYGYLDSDSVLGFPKPSQEYCTDVQSSSCSRSDLFAFQVSSGVAISACGIIGFYTWYISRRVHTALPSTPEGRLFGYLPESEELASIHFAFQVWDFFISLLIAEHRTAMMLLHHVAAAAVCYLSLEFQVR